MGDFQIIRSLFVHYSLLFVHYAHEAIQKIRYYLGATFGSLGGIFGSLEAILGALEGILGGLGEVFGMSWGVLGRSWNGLGGSWKGLGGVLGSPGYKGLLRAPWVLTNPTRRPWPGSSASRVEHPPPSPSVRPIVATPYYCFKEKFE